jgi:hypothetical protein
MKVLFDVNTPHPLKRHLTEHEVTFAQDMGWSELRNGDLIRAAEGRFDVLLTADQNLRYQQNLRGRTLAIVVLPTNRLREVLRYVEDIRSALATLTRGEFVEIPRK